MDPTRRKLKELVACPDGVEDAYEQVCATLESDNSFFGPWRGGWTTQARARSGIYNTQSWVLWISVDLDPDNVDKEEETHVIVSDLVGSCCACSGVMAGAPPYEAASELDRYMEHMRYLVDRATIVDTYEEAQQAFVDVVRKTIYSE